MKKGYLKLEELPGDIFDCKIREASRVAHMLSEAMGENLQMFAIVATAFLKHCKNHDLDPCVTLTALNKFQ